ncbi:MAG: EAL domain-containing protein [Proteobacteria bacterium]|nr:EAL domain-containing protein [Pseudomonadota bacterium]
MLQAKPKQITIYQTWSDVTMFKKPQMMNDSIKYNFDFESILDQNQQSQGWSEILLRPYKFDKLIPPEFFFRQLSKEQTIELEIRIFKYIGNIQKEIKPQRLSVNLTPVSLESAEFRQTIIQLISNKQIEAHTLCVEILEHQTLGHISHEIIQFLKFLRNHGVWIALDDFGTGNAHWKFIQMGIIDVIKIAYQKQLDIDVDAKIAYTQALFTFARSLKITTVLEGVENRSDLELGKSMGFKNFQGWLFKKPIHSVSIASGGLNANK